MENLQFSESLLHAEGTELIRQQDLQQQHVRKSSVLAQTSMLVSVTKTVIIRVSIQLFLI